MASWNAVFLAVAALLCAGAAASSKFDGVVQPSWANDHVVYEDDLLKLRLDSSSGGGFASKNKFLYGKATADLKLVPGDSADEYLDRRVDDMVGGDMVEELREYFATTTPWERAAHAAGLGKAISLPELGDYFAGRKSLHAAVDEIRANIRVLVATHASKIRRAPCRCRPRRRGRHLGSRCPRAEVRVEEAEAAAMLADWIPCFSLLSRFSLVACFTSWSTLKRWHECDTRTKKYCCRWREI